MLVLLVLVGLLFPLVLGACGEASVKANTPTISPVSTPVTTAAPSPTPEPDPNKLLLGGKDSPWGEITRFTGDPSSLKEYNLNEDSRKGLSNMLAFAPALAPVAGASSKSNLYTLALSPELRKGLADGSLRLMNSLEGGVRGVVVDSTTGVIRGVASLKAVGGVAALTLGPPGIALFVTLTAIEALQFQDDINKQLETINKNVTDIKQFLEADKRSLLEGNLKYLNNMADLLNKQKLSPTDVDSFRNQLEAIEVQTLQITALMQDQMDKAYNEFDKQSLSKNFVFFSDGDKVKKLQQFLGDHKRFAGNYFTALSVRGLAAQVRSAMPESRTLAQTRLEDVRGELSKWGKSQGQFYDRVENRVSELDGWLSSEETRNQFRKEAQAGRQNTNQSFSQLDELLVNTVQKVKNQNDSASKPLQLVIMLDDKGNVVKVSKAS